jgi:hypothetical protein
MDIALLIWAVALTVLVVVGVVWILDLQAQLRQLREREQKRVVPDEGNITLGSVVESLAERLADTTARTERLMARGAQIDAVLGRTVQGVGLVRFRAFQDTGGDQSFALALTDGEGNGIVLSALYGRGATRLYAKPVEGWLSPRPLGEEEEQALAQARQNILGPR